MFQNPENYTSYDPSASVSSPSNTTLTTSTPEHAGDRSSLTNAEMGILAQACRTLQFSSRFLYSLLAKNIDQTFHLQYFIRRTSENTPEIITLIFSVRLFLSNVQSQACCFMCCQRHGNYNYYGQMKN